MEFPLGLIGWIVIGGLAGWIGSKIMGTDQQQGILLNIIVGVVGAFLGGWILSFFLDMSSPSKFATFLTAIFGSVVLLWVVKLVTRSK